MDPVLLEQLEVGVRPCQPLPSPKALREELPLTDAQAGTIHRARQAVRQILRGEDRRLLAIVGPCSIHDASAGLEYAERLTRFAAELEDRIVVVMRAYVEKPRTGIGWAGLLHDPHLDGSGDLARGLRLSRRFLRDVVDLGLAPATEFLDPISPQYLADLVGWSAIGARTCESQLHRQMASGLPMPVGFKNPTGGSIEAAVNGIQVAARPHAYIGVDDSGRATAMRTVGNDDAHLVLRGGSGGPNCSPAHVTAADKALRAAGNARGIVVDCSHDNSARKPERQPKIALGLVAQKIARRLPIAGVMLESNLLGGRQELRLPVERLKRGVSITDACLDWPATERCLAELYAVMGGSIS